MERRESPYPCTIVRHRGARRMTLRVKPSGVRLTIPPRTPAAQVDAFLRASGDWVREQRALLCPPPPPLADGDRLAYLDGALDLVVGTLARGRPRARRESGALLVGVPAGADVDAVVERWYRREAREVLLARSRDLAARMDAHLVDVTVRDPRSRWGSCSRAGRISYSWRLLLAPESVLDYVVAHEVCHLRRHDHSPAFWELVHEACPEAGEARRWLRRHGPDLYRGPAWRAPLTTR